MPIIQGPNADKPTDEYPNWGLSKWKKGQKNGVEPHYHDCDEFYFMVEGKCVAKSEGKVYTLEKGDVLATRMGDEHEIMEILEDSTIFWIEAELKGKKREGHLHAEDRIND